MKRINRVIVVLELFLVLPATLFMAALFVRELQPPSYEPARSARLLVDWFAARPFLGLDIFLIAMPLAAFVIGCVTVARAWRRDLELRQAVSTGLAALRAHLAAACIAGATLVAGSVLAIVALHMITD